MEIVETIGSLLLGGVFVWTGCEHFLNFKEMTAVLAERVRAPALALSVGSLVEIAAGAILAFGYFPRYAALTLIVFTVAASFLMLDFWRHEAPMRQMLRSAFMVNIALIGGLLLVAAQN